MVRSRCIGIWDTSLSSVYCVCTFYWVTPHVRNLFHESKPGLTYRSGTANYGGRRAGQRSFPCPNHCVSCRYLLPRECIRKNGRINLNLAGWLRLHGPWEMAGCYQNVHLGSHLLYKDETVPHSQLSVWLGEWCSLHQASCPDRLRDYETVRADVRAARDMYHSFPRPIRREYHVHCQRALRRSTRLTSAGRVSSPDYRS